MHSQSSRALALARSINSKRLIALLSFVGLIGLVRVFAYPVPEGAFLLLAFWLFIGLSYDLSVKPLMRIARPEAMTAAMFAVDVTLITAMHAVVGGGWWMGSAVYLVVANAAYSYLPRALGRMVSGYAAFSFLVMVLSHTLGVGEYQPFLGIQTIEGHYSFGIVAAVFGTMVMIVGTFLQDAFVKHTHESAEHLAQSQREVLERLASAAEFRDGETSRHTERVGEISGRIARELGFDRHYSEMISFAARLHDIGKIGIPDAILLKAGKLSPDEFEIMTLHTVMGARILSGGSSEVVQLAERIALSHHERWDGTGYPDKLKGEDIPIEARIVAVADVVDALSFSRPYRQAWPRPMVMSFIEQGSGTHFDPRVVNALFDVMTKEAPEESSSLAVA